MSDALDVGPGDPSRNWRVLSGVVLAGVVNAAVLSAIGYGVKRAIDRTDAVPVIEERIDNLEQRQDSMKMDLAEQISDGFESIDKRLGGIEKRIETSVTESQHEALAQKVDRHAAQLADARVAIAKLEAQNGESK